MKRAIPPGLPRSAWIVLVALLLFRSITYALTDFSATGDGVTYMKNAGLIGTHHILPPLSVQPNAYAWLLSWFQVHKDPAAALQRIGRTQQLLDASIVITLCWLAMKLLGRTKPWLLVGAWTLIVFQPFTGIWSRTIYTEQTVSFLSFAGFLVLSASLFNRQSKSIALLGIGAAGAALGLASILRSDVLALNTVLLLGIILYLSFLAGNWLRWRRLKILTLILAYIAIPLLMSTYQYASSGEFGIFNNKRDLESYFGWIRTWPATPREYEVFAFLSQRQSWTLDNYPAKAFDSTEEKKAFSDIMEQWKKQYFATSATIDAQFNALTREKISKNPIRHYILNPIQRMYYFWVSKDGSQFYTIPYGLKRPISTAVAGLIFLARLLMIALFMAGFAGLILKLKKDRWSFAAENWLFFFCWLSCVYVLLRTFELGLLSSFMIAGLMELRFISIAMPFFLLGALLGAHQLTGREQPALRLGNRAR